MSDSKDRHDSTEQGDATERQDATEPRDATPAKGGGFGAFSQQYRDRWAANHPKSRRIHGDAASEGKGAPPSRAAEAPSDADDRDVDDRSGMKP